MINRNSLVSCPKQHHYLSGQGSNPDRSEECSDHEATTLTILFQVGMDKNIASLSVPLGQLKEEVLVRV